MVAAGAEPGAVAAAGDCVCHPAACEPLNGDSTAAFTGDAQECVSCRLSGRAGWLPLYPSLVWGRITSYQWRIDGGTGAWAGQVGALGAADADGRAARTHAPVARGDGLGTYLLW